MTMYERIKNMTKEEMQDFIYWVYENGIDDGRHGFEDSYGYASYFGGAILNESVDDVMHHIENFYNK